MYTYFAVIILCSAERAPDDLQQRPDTLATQNASRRERALFAHLKVSII